MLILSYSLVTVLTYCLVIVVGYLLGSLNFSVLLSRGLGGDVRKKGSGNAGATNMARIYGMGAGLLTMALDMVKAVLAMLLGWHLLSDWGLMAGGVSCIVGHCFPVFYRFRGGKGISVGGAIALAIDWRVGLFVIGAFALGALLTRKVSFGSICASVAILLATLLFRPSLPRLLLAGLSMLVALYQHRSNMKRLAEGTEPDFKPKDGK